MTLDQSTTDETPQPITSIPTPTEERTSTSNIPLDTFLGGGFVPSQTILLSGQPGAGKSTFLLQLATLLAKQGSTILYLSGEESLGQIKLRADRINALQNLIFCSETMELQDIYHTIETINPHLIIVDSIQMLEDSTFKAEIRSKKQTKHCLLDLTSYIKHSNRILIAIGHATKTGIVAGDNTLQHMVDTVLFLHLKTGQRFLYSSKNRFGPTETDFPLTMEQTGFKELTPTITYSETTTHPRWRFW